MAFRRRMRTFRRGSVGRRRRSFGMARRRRGRGVIRRLRPGRIGYRL